MRVFDDPSHPHYGPVRRQWIIFAQLGLLNRDEQFYQEWGQHWDDFLVTLIRNGCTETHATRCITYNMLNLF